MVAGDFMSEDTTQNMPDARSFEERVMARFDAMDARFTAIDARLDGIDARLDAMDARLDGIDTRLATLEEKVERRLMETRPIWEAVQAQIKQLDKKFDTVILDHYEMRTDIRALDERMTNLEKTRSQ